MAVRRLRVFTVSLGACTLIAAAAFSLRTETFAATPAKSERRSNAPQHIDVLIADAAKSKNLTPLPICDDPAFLRRATLDLIGRIPTYDEYQLFFKDPAPQRRENLLQRLLNSPAFVDRWSVFFGEMLNVRSREEYGRGLDLFIRKSLADKKPYDQMAREMISAAGSTKGAQPAGFLLAENGDPFQLAAKTTHVFLGTRISCAQCHNHPFDTWKRRQFYGVAAYFGKTRLYFPNDQANAPVVTDDQNNVVHWPPNNKKAPPLDPAWPFPVESKTNLQEVLDRRNAKLEARTADEILVDRSPASSSSPLRKDNDFAYLDSARDTMEDAAEKIRLAPTRDKLAELVTSAQNRLFAETFANRLWAELLGRGIVNPVDDFRADNPPSNPALLKFLGEEFVASDYDIRAVLHTIMLTQTYQRIHASADSPNRKLLEENFCAAPLRRMFAEQVYDSIVVAGHLTRPKHRPGQNLRQVSETLVIAREKNPPAPEKPVAPQPAEKMTPTEKAPAENADAEIDDLLSNPEEKVKMLAGVEMLADPQEVLKPTTPERRPAKDYTYEYKRITRVYDFNPSFSTAFEIRAPAPPEHFLRQFGQSPRQLLGDQRDQQPALRQALILMNGDLANEAARLGELEPLFRLLAEENLQPAIRRIYIDILTREPTAAEHASAQSLLATAATRADSLSDLRWTLLNSLEFRYLP